MKNTFILLVLVCLLFSCNEKKEEIKELIRPVRYGKVIQSGGKEMHTFSGAAQSSEETNLSFRVAGNVRTLNVKLGDRVGRGQLIATVDPSDYSIQVEQALASQKGTEANVKSAESQIRSAETQVKSAETQLITTRAAYRRVENLYENNSVPLSEYEQAKASFETAETQYEAAKSNLNAAKASYEAAKTQVTSASKQTQSAKNQVNYTKLVAPFSGVITAVNVEANELVGSGTPIAVLSSENQPEVNVGVPEVFITKIKKKQKATIHFSAIQGKSFNGVVEEVAYAAGNSPTYPIIVRINNPSKNIRPGMAANVTFNLDDGKKTTQQFTVCPIQAVGEDEKGNFVFTLQKGVDNKYIVKRKSITVGQLLPSGFEIKEGIEDGELVATAGLKTILDGQEVLLLEE